MKTDFFKLQKKKINQQKKKKDRNIHFKYRKFRNKIK
jgi:hypothetical protein